MTTLTVLSHADFSGRIKRSKRNPGFSVFATTVDNIREQNNVLLLDAGDSFCTNFWPGLPCVEAENLLHSDVMVLGNHEFDRGKDFLENCISHATFPILCSNIVEKGTKNLVKGTKPWVILEKFNLRIGVLGITTAYTPYMVTATAFESFEALDPIETSKFYIPQIRKEGVDILILLAHVPFYIAQDNSVSGELIDILEGIPAVDFCMGGHIPGDYAGFYTTKANYKTILLKGGFSGHSLCRTDISFDSDTKKIIGAKPQVLLTNWDLKTKKVYQDKEDEIVKPFLSFFEDVLCQSTKEYYIRLSRETELGDWLASCLQEAAKVDFAYMNATSASGEIHPGPVTAEDLTSVMGFNDYLYTSQMTGQEIYNLFETIFDPVCYGNNAGVFFAGVKVNIDHTKKAFSKVQSICLKDGQPLVLDKLYRVGTSEYMSTGGNGTKSVANKLKWTKTETRMHDAMVNCVKAHGGLEFDVYQRLFEIGKPENDNAPY